MANLKVKLGKDGVWYARPYLGTDSATGKRNRPFKQFPDAESEEDAQAMADEWAAGLAGAARLGVSMRLGSLLTRYVDDLDVRGYSANTIKSYYSQIRRNVEPYIGDIDPRDLHPSDVSDLYRELLENGGTKGGGLAGSTVVRLHNLLCTAFKWMCSKGIVKEDPMRSVEKPSARPREAVSYNEEQVGLILGAANRLMAKGASEPNEVFWRNVAMATVVALYTGARCGEVCALRWKDIRFACDEVHIGGNVVEVKGNVRRVAGTKNGKSRNVAMGKDLKAALLAHRDWQPTYICADKRQRDELPVIAGTDCRFMRPSQISAAFSSLRGKLGLPSATSFHTLRHTHATLLMGAGVDLRTVQERLGHADSATTLRVYAHAMPGRDRAAADAFGDAVGGLGGQE